ncbi:polyketide cyclase [Sphingobacterium sp. DK4209]|uniref:Polyketide cyclase n=1 Tax=Sphingobacterium zhuxiongii TaxID=2662364 RepID=A0A5Q0QAZ9_9SPHI|nr:MULTISPECIES: SRPBCC family protein [unclassified Sphingobacterium]MVZ65144.1 polyketide cyclase [Sphingobacterium sp. DK4209]QGA26091.1 polyketide cyclase [Sphingobacterium sp. dk4302]
MKFLKYLLFIVLGLLALVLIIGLIVPKDFHAGSEIVINKPRQEVFDYVKYIKNQHKFDAWSRKDPNITQAYEGTDGTVGFIYTWKSSKVGDGKQVISKIDEGKRIDMDLYFNGSDQANKSYMAVEDAGAGQSKISWVIDGQMPYPWNVMTLFFDMSKDFDSGLSNLKEILEKQ